MGYNLRSCHSTHGERESVSTAGSQLGTVWQVVASHSTSSIVPAVSARAANPEQVVLHNNVSEEVVAGVTIAHSLVNVVTLRGGESASFDVHPKYHVALYWSHTAKEGCLVASETPISPITVEIGNFRTASITAVNHGGTYKLICPEYT